MALPDTQSGRETISCTIEEMSAETCGSPISPTWNQGGTFHSTTAAVVGRDEMSCDSVENVSGLPAACPRMNNVVA